MAGLYHLDTDFLVHGLAHRGPERERLQALGEGDAEIQMSAMAWFEYSRGPRTPSELAVGRSFFIEGGIVPLTEELADRAAEVFRALGSPRRRAADIAIGVTAAEVGAVLLTRNARDFRGIPNLVVEATEGE